MLQQNLHQARQQKHWRRPWRQNNLGPCTLAEHSPHLRATKATRSPGLDTIHKMRTFANQLAPKAALPSFLRSCKQKPITQQLPVPSQRNFNRCCSCAPRQSYKLSCPPSSGAASTNRPPSDYYLKPIQSKGAPQGPNTNCLRWRTFRSPGGHQAPVSADALHHDNTSIHHWHGDTDACCRNTAPCTACRIGRVL